MKRVRFSRAELELLNDMCGIASAASWGEGDYIGEFDKKGSGKVFDSLRNKVWELISRADGLPNNLSEARR